MATGSSSGSGDFEALMRQYWNTWGPAAAHATASAGQAPPTAWPWQAMLDSANPLWGAAATGGAEDAAHRFNSQAGDWLGTMQQVAARFAGRDSSSAEVAAAWREAVQGQEGGLLRWMLDAARGGNALGDQPWIREFSRWAQGGFGSQEPWLNIPGFGPAREHQARWQALLKMQQHYQTRAEAYVEQIRSVLDEAFQLFEQRLGAHESPGSQLTSARAMFDLWIDVAEEAYSKAALSEEFREIYAELANAQMRLRAATQHELEKACEVMGVPTRSEMDAAHRKIAELERLLRRMAAAAPSTTAPPSADQAAPAPRARAASKATANKATANKATAAKAAPARPRKRAPAAGKSR